MGWATGKGVEPNGSWEAANAYKRDPWSEVLLEFLKTPISRSRSVSQYALGNIRLLRSVKSIYKSSSLTDLRLCVFSLKFYNDVHLTKVRWGRYAAVKQHTRPFNVRLQVVLYLYYNAVCLRIPAIRIHTSFKSRRLVEQRKTRATPEFNFTCMTARNAHVQALEFHILSKPIDIWIPQPCSWIASGCKDRFPGSQFQHAFNTHTISLSMF